VRVLIVDDHEVVRRGVRSLLATRGDFDVCGEAVDGRDAITKAQQLRPDVITMDISMPNLNGLEATREIRRILPEIPILIMSQHDVPEMMKQALSAGATAYIVKSSISTELIAVLDRVRRKESSPGLVFGSAQANVDFSEILQRSAALEKALQESEERFRLTFEQAGVGMAHVDWDGHFVRVNRKLCEIVGYTESELRQMTFQEITHPDDLPADLALTSKVVSGQSEGFAMEKRYFRKDRQIVWVNLTVVPLRDSQGHFKYSVSVIEEITARKKAEAELLQTKRELQQREELFRAIVDTTPECVKLVAPDGTLLLMNPSGLRMIRADSAEQVVGKSIYGPIAPNDREKYRAFHERICQGHRGSLEFDVVDMHGAVVHMDSHSAPLRQPDGTFVHLAITRDITERKQSQNVQGRLAAIVESSDDAIISKDLDGNIISWNAAAQRIFGYTAEEAIGQSIFIIVPPELHDEERSILSRLRAGQPVDHFETVRCTKSGQLRHISLSSSLVRDSQGRVIGASKIARDITERKHVEQALKEAELSGRLLQLQDEERRRIAREMHDSTGQLVAALNMNLCKIAKEKQGLSDAGKACVEESLDLSQQILAEVRTLSHLLHPPLLDEVGLASALREYVSGFVTRSNIHVDLELPAELQPLSRDCELSIFRIVQEALTNIHRHSGSATALVRLKTGVERMILEISDQGHGMDDSVQQNFVQGKGSGVGLRGMRERVRQIGGSLEITSNLNGTSVIATLPLRQQPVSHASVTSL
jgi:PAS domain S-box-containing protein